jgi:hypothetical protein
MLGQDRSVWLQVTHAVESLAEQGHRVWAEPAAVQKALGELLSVFPVTHVQIDLTAIFRARGEEDWPALLSRAEPWKAFLAEFVLAISEAVRPPAVWGLGLPGPHHVVAALSDESERGILKAGLQLASFLQALRESPVGFVAVDLRQTEMARTERAIAPILRNSTLYGWRRAVCLDELPVAANPPTGAEIALIHNQELPALRSFWDAGKLIGGGLSATFWQEGRLAEQPPRQCLLYGVVPHDILPKVLVESGRALRAWLIS